MPASQITTFTEKKLGGIYRCDEPYIRPNALKVEKCEKIVISTVSC